MTEKRFKIYDKETMDTHIEDTKDLYSDGSPKTYWFMENEDFCDLFNKLNELSDENEQLKQMLKEVTDVNNDLITKNEWYERVFKANEDRIVITFDM